MEKALHNSLFAQEKHVPGPDNVYKYVVDNRAAMSLTDVLPQSAELAFSWLFTGRRRRCA